MFNLFNCSVSYYIWQTQENSEWYKISFDNRPTWNGFIWVADEKVFTTSLSKQIISKLLASDIEEYPLCNEFSNVRLQQQIIYPEAEE